MVLRDFNDVFPEDVPRLPLKSDMEFTIKLVSRTTLISKAPYK
ncbi:hypothetical protein CK203_109504 [Vitis vinifera]|uniref:Uncharacterized protein n=1 Tax=Vitis vinifera TaxID=29760 RepID=A0A438CHA1_VITVI|nr:hypothetical protein CK203_109504 [Vitis vinifera]